MGTSICIQIINKKNDNTDDNPIVRSKKAKHLKASNNCKKKIEKLDINHNRENC